MDRIGCARTIGEDFAPQDHVEAATLCDRHISLSSTIDDRNLGSQCRRGHDGKEARKINRVTMDLIRLEGNENSAKTYYKAQLLP